MTPEYLACPCTNPQLEPIRRRIEASIPSYNTVLDYGNPDNKADFVMPPYGTNVVVNDTLQPYVRPTTTSLENPLLRLTDQEYRTLRYEKRRGLTNSVS